MRTLNIEVTDTTVVYPDGKLAGRIGEHNATQLIIALPEQMLDDIDYHIISFDTLRGSVVSGHITSDDTKEAYISDGSIYCSLWQELTRFPALMFTVEAYAVTDNEPVMIAKSPYIDELYFELSADDNAEEADTSGYGLACEVDKLAQASHKHDNKSLLDSYAQPEAALAGAVERSHTHANMALLDNVTASFDTKADKTVPSNEGAFAALDGDGNLRDSGLTPNNFIKINSGVTPGFGHIPVFFTGSSSQTGATVTDSGCTVNDFVQKVEGMGLSTNDFTTYYKDKLDILDPNTFYHTGENIDLNRYVNAGLHIFNGTLDSQSRPWDNEGKVLVMLVADEKRDDVLEIYSCLQYAFGSSTVVFRPLDVHDNGQTVVGMWTPLCGDLERLGVDSDGNITVDDVPIAFDASAAVVDTYVDLPEDAEEGVLFFVNNDTQSGEGVSVDLTQCPLHEDVYTQLIASYVTQGGTYNDAGWSEYRDNYTNCEYSENQIKFGTPTYHSSESVLSLGNSGVELGSNYDSSDVAVFPALVLLSDDYEDREDSENFTIFPSGGIYNYGYMPGFAFNLDYAEFEAFVENGVTKYRTLMAYAYAFEDISGEAYGTDGMLDGEQFTFSEGWNQITLVAVLNENGEMTIESAYTETVADLAIPYGVGFWSIAVDKDLEGQEATVVPLIRQTLYGLLIDMSQQTVIPKGLYIKTENGWRWIG